MQLIPCHLYIAYLLFSLLGKLLAVLKTHASKNRFDRFVNRKSRLDNLGKCDRLVNDFNTDFVVCFLPSFDYSGSFQLSRLIFMSNLT